MIEAATRVLPRSYSRIKARGRSKFERTFALLVIAVLALLAMPSRAGAQLIQTVAGNGSLGYSGDGGPATNSELNNPFGVAVDSRGNVYIADDNNERIRVVNTGSSPITVANVNILPGDIATVAGNGTAGYTGDGGPATSAEINNPSGVAVDSSGNIYIADLYNYVIRKVNTNGIISTVAGNGTGAFNGDGPATSASIYAYAVAVDTAGNLYIGDASNNRIRAVNMGNNAITVAGVTIQPGYIATVAGNGVEGYSGNGVPAGSAELFYPYSVAVDSHGNIYICDTYNRMIRVVNAGTSAITVATITIQPGNIATVAGNGTYGGAGDGGPATAAAFADPDGVAVDSAGNIYVSDLESSRIRFVDNSTGIASTLTASAGLYGYNGDNIPAAIALLSYPRCLAVDAAGNIYIADQPNQRIREIVVNTGSFSSRASTAFVVGAAGAFAVTTDDQPTPVLTYSGTLPGGVTFVDKGNGIGMLSGVPQSGTEGTYNLTLTASNGVFPNAVQNFVLSVYDPGTVPVASSVTFLSQDATTQGSWQGVYGADGYSIANLSTQVIPAYASFSVQNQDNYTWDASTTDSRALQIPNSSAGIASTWYNNVSFSFDLNVGASSHQFSIYALDWDAKGRSETVQILDQNTGAPLDTRTISNFGSGVYLSWNVTGHVQVVVTVLGGANAVVNGVFFGGAGGGSGTTGNNPFLTSYTQGEIRRNYTGWIGTQFTVGANSLAVSSLGRICIAGDNEFHTIEIVTAATGTVVPGATLQLNMSGCSVGQFLYASLPSAITLQGNGVYYLVSYEFSNGDYWYDNRPVTSSTDGTVNAGIYSPDGATWIASGGPNYAYGPPNFLYTVDAGTPIPITVNSNPAGLSFTVDGTTYNSAQSFSWTSGSLHTIAATSPQNAGPGAQYAWSSWSDGGAISHTVSPAGATAFTVNFTTQYLLTTGVSPSGGGSVVASPSSSTGYYNSATPVQLTAAANPACSFANWSGALSGSTISQTLVMSGPLTVTANFQCSGTPQTTFLTAYDLNSPPIRNNFSGWVGFKVTVGANPLSVSWVGRICVSGNSASHTVEFVNASTGAGVPGGSALVNLSGCTPGQFRYASLPSPITLQANTSYYLASQEVNGGDLWYDHGGISSTNDALVNSSIYSYDGANWIPLDGENTSYGPPNFLYVTVLPVPVAVTVQSTPAAASFVVDGTTYTGSQLFSWTAGSLHTIAATTPQSAGTGTQFAWSSWSDGGAISHTISPTSAGTFTAAFATQYLLTTTVVPTGGGAITASPSSTNGYYTSGTQVQLTPAANPICTFTDWTGGLSGTASPQAVTMNDPLTETANFQCSGPASTDFLTGYALNSPPLRNNFTGWVGMKLTVGTSPLSVSSVGRICVNGNSGMHTVKFVNVNTGADVVGGSASLNLSGCIPGQFFYSPLASPITLQANTAYYLVSPETIGGDQWYDYGTVSSTIVAVINSSIYSYDGVNWYSVSGNNTSYVPVDFQYSLAPADPTFVTGYNLSNSPVRNDFSGWVGMRFDVGASGMVVSALGRIVLPGNSGAHTVKLVQASNGMDVPGASASVSLAGATAGQFSYTSLPSPIVLPANGSYYLVSQESAGGDQWYDFGTISTTTAGAVTNAVYSTDSTNWNLLGGANSSYVPPNLK
jgi:hypothetical protein